MGERVVEVHPDRYRIERDPFAFSIVIHPEGHMPVMEDLKREKAEEMGRVLVDTRCLAMIDREFLDDASLAWRSISSCGSTARTKPAAICCAIMVEPYVTVSADLAMSCVYCVPEEDVVALWPDVDEPAVDGQ